MSTLYHLPCFHKILLIIKYLVYAVMVGIQIIRCILLLKWHRATFVCSCLDVSVLCLCSCLFIFFMFIFSFIRSPSWWELCLFWQPATLHELLCYSCTVLLYLWRIKFSPSLSFGLDRTREIQCRKISSTYKLNYLNLMRQSLCWGIINYTTSVRWLTTDFVIVNPEHTFGIWSNLLPAYNVDR